jgi:hypothetical protein
MADVFLSYAREDQFVASRLADALNARGWSVFWDRQIHAGPRFEDVISRELGAAKCMVVLWSSASVKSDWVLDEANEGKTRGVLVQATIEDVRAPFGFRQYQAASLVGWDGDAQHGGVQDLFSGIEMAARQQPSPSVDAMAGRAAAEIHAPTAVAPLESARKAPASRSRMAAVAICAALAAASSIAYLVTLRRQPASESARAQGDRRVALSDRPGPASEENRTPETSRRTPGRSGSRGLPLPGDRQRQETREASERDELMSKTLANMLLPKDAQETYRRATLAFRNFDWPTAASLFGRAASFHDDSVDLRVSIGPSDSMRYLPNLYAAQAFRRLMDCAGVERSLARLEAAGVVEANPDIRSDVASLRLWCSASALK